MYSDLLGVCNKIIPYLVLPQYYTYSTRTGTGMYSVMQTLLYTLLWLLSAAKNKLLRL